MNNHIHKELYVANYGSLHDLAFSTVTILTCKTDGRTI